MNTQQIIMVLIDDREWTLEALHCACLMARNIDAGIVLVQTIPVPHLSWLGEEWISTPFASHERSEFADYQTIIEDYAVEFTPLLLQYTTLTEAIVQAAEQVKARVVFAKLPKSLFPFWARFQRWALKRHLAGQRCQWVQHAVYGARTTSVVAGISCPAEHGV